ncbi:LysM peptidoglycan-binding domain-containing protein [Streptococcus pyogenes]|uniref:LysM peptidoglycan-binding domain-containing protein n=1 Tax=Streptococcus pyogenes TaxID=1314 RepID=UPI00165C1756|nr:LysM domain-containing protein [Streptococcus pyogenes]QNQ71720.1 LysM peptidoglycan-binding domain-containing protein [Streptococcus pyogenes]HEP6771017.1 LysM peptidoglycan-binding domain-containing protein [Streptococcus pyogenes]HEP7017349.1 LysM peptidoglycan-binding domain-containing protein [Streptococcus pyogenes]HEQ0903947.1 LysM peptidoglycan-binding domain-containing protein [Streptococcus pyogenes]HER1490607.1 LysM peptidoglycan-binding domain-containing protein [Streptococcus p
MIITKKSLFVTSVALSLAPLATAQAQEWTPRSVTEIKSELVLVDNVFTYTVKYGDTLSTIAEAMGIDVHVLGDINHIANIDLIFPDTILTANYNQHGQATTLTVQAPASSPASVSHVPSSEPLPQASATSQSTVPMAPSATPSDVPTTPFASAKPDSSVTASSELTSSTNDVSTELSSESQKQPEVPQEAVPTPKAAETTEVEPKTDISEDSTSANRPVPNESASEEVSSAAPAQAPAEKEETSQMLTAPAAQKAVADTTSVATSNGLSYAPNHAYNPMNAGLQPQTAAFKEEVASAFGITLFSGYRPGDPGDHGKGLAIDFMVPENSALGDQVAQYAIDHMAERGISYVIWKQRFYAPFASIYGPAYTWNPMPDRGSITENHYDHVHVSFNA